MLKIQYICKFNVLFIYLAVLGLSCSMWDLVPEPGMEPRPPRLGAQSLSYCTTREVPPCQLQMKLINDLQTLFIQENKKRIGC